MGNINIFFQSLSTNKQCGGSWPRLSGWFALCSEEKICSLPLENIWLVNKALFLRGAKPPYGCQPKNWRENSAFTNRQFFVRLPIKPSKAHGDWCLFGFLFHRLG